MDSPQSQITSLLSAVGNGDAAAADLLWRVVYDELHRIAHARMAHESQRGDLQTTVLVQEAYLRLMRGPGAGTEDGGPGAKEARSAPFPANRRHFFAAASNAMRQFLVDDARKRGREKRGGGRPGPAGEGGGRSGKAGQARRVRPGDLGEAAVALNWDAGELLALDDALAKLRTIDERKAEIVQLRYFAGLTGEEIAELLGVSPRLVDKEWRFIYAWLKRELSTE